MFRIFVSLLGGSYSRNCSAAQRERSSGLVIFTVNCSVTTDNIRTILKKVRKHYVPEFTPIPNSNVYSTLAMALMQGCMPLASLI